ncbi:uncharacterized protein CTRU02_203240 [Colletotrichum truncatum]|uniref:Integral membrane protein n=1 Tax=Colletotrichum truncatum TaxID=5467 RepID=A0ACC3Z8U6_COLTU|nr:uncharacterized protein CTRU02_09080 [Colletotrichum truncatum]KAF6789288.1 integral membrane protein [Colletotrichum truncatum]
MSEVSVIPAPPGVVVDFDHPRRQKVLEHYLLFDIGGTIAFIALCQRLYTKIFLSTGLQTDDTSIIRGSMCAHAWEMPLSKFKSNSLITYIAAPVYMLCSGFTKLSLLAFYLHLSPQKWFRIAIWIGITVVSLNTACITALMLFQCNPIQKGFDSTITGGSCLNAAILYMATAVSNIASDVMLFVLPMPMVFKLHMRMAQKLGLVIMFAVGSIALRTVATSIVRMTFLPILLTSRDPPWDSAPANIWTFLEGNLFVICGSMPTIRKFFEHFAPKLMGLPTASSSVHYQVTDRVPIKNERHKRRDEENAVLTSVTVTSYVINSADNDGS